VLNLIIAIVGSLVLRVVHPTSAGVDQTSPEDYLVDRPDDPIPKISVPSAALAD
jgi:hypothetical protein